MIGFKRYDVDELIPSSNLAGVHWGFDLKPTHAENSWETEKPLVFYQMFSQTRRMLLQHRKNIAPSGKLTQHGEIHLILNGQILYKWLFSIAILT